MDPFACRELPEVDGFAAKAHRDFGDD